MPAGHRTGGWPVVAVVVAATIAAALAVAPWSAAAGLPRRDRKVEDLSPAELSAKVDSLLADPRIPGVAKIHALEQLLEVRGELKESWFYKAANALGRLYLSEGAREPAIHYLELAVDGIDDNADLLNTLGYLYAEENAHLERAAALVRRALEVVAPDTPEPVIGYYRDSLGWALFRQGKFDSALVELEVADRLAPDNAEIRGHLVETYDALGRRDDAEGILIDDLVAARGVDPERRARLRRLHRTTPQGKPVLAELEVERRVLAAEAEEIAAVEAEGGQVIRLESGDGFPLVGTLYPAAKKRSPAAILVPMLAGARSDYHRLARLLATSGISALCLDVRGHGASITEEVPSPAVSREDMPRYLHGALLDLKAAIRYLRQSPIAKAQPLALVGASFGGFLSALASADEEAVTAIVLLSPGATEPYTEAIARRPERATLFVAGEQDGPGRAGADEMLKHLDRSRSQLVVYHDAGYGTEMLERAPELMPLIVRWLGSAFKGARDL